DRLGRDRLQPGQEERQEPEQQHHGANRGEQRAQALRVLAVAVSPHVSNKRDEGVTAQRDKPQDDCKYEPAHLSLLVRALFESLFQSGQVFWPPALDVALRSPLHPRDGLISESFTAALRYRPAAVELARDNRGEPNHHQSGSKDQADGRAHHLAAAPLKMKPNRALPAC